MFRVVARQVIVTRSLVTSQWSCLQHQADSARRLLQQYALIQRPCHCLLSTKPPLTDGEKAITNKLKAKFPGIKSFDVSDISGGCGAMYQISIEAEEFRDKKTIDQHRLVNEALSEEIKSMHGLQLTTKVPEK